MLLPLMIVYFHRLSLASLVLNILVSILLAVLVAVALLALLIAQVSAVIAAPLLKLADLINWLMVHSVDPFLDFGWATFRLPEYSGPAAVIYEIYFHTGGRSPCKLSVVANCTATFFRSRVHS
jgi:predicted membrane metal-binding protein